jgi:broad specificity phosphatase PhoE
MRHLVLVKHAAPEVVAGASPETWKLSEKGRASCAPLAEALRRYDPRVLVCSEEAKAAETAELVAQSLGVPWETAPGLHEHDRSNVPHMRSGEFISTMEVVFRRPRQLVLGRETAAGALARFRNALDDVLERHGGEGDNVAVVSHGTVIALLLEHASGRNGFELWRRMQLPSFAVLELPGFTVREVVERLAGG